MTEDEFISFLDHKLWEIGDTIIKYYNPCQIDGNSCIVSKINPCCVYTRFGKDGCQYQNNGCQNPNTMCVLWLCKTAIKNTNPKCVEALSLLQHLGNLYNIVGKPMIGQAYIGADRPKEK